MTTKADGTWTDDWPWIVTSLARVKTKHSDFAPTAIVDVGANVGRWSYGIRQHFPSTKLLLIEASEIHAQQLAKIVTKIGNAEFRIALLTDKSGDRVGFYSSGDTGNSIFLEQSPSYEKKRPVSRITQTLDQVIQGSFLKNEIIDVVKADVQGAELVVLQGGIQALSQATFVFFEGSAVEYNKGGSCFHDVDAFLRSQGFYLYDLSGFITSAPAFKTDGFGQFDALYVKPTSPRLPMLLKEMNPKFCGQGRPVRLLSNNRTLSCSSLGIDEMWTSSTPTWIPGFLLGSILGFLAVGFHRPQTRLGRKHSGK